MTFSAALVLFEQDPGIDELETISLDLLKIFCSCKRSLDWIETLLEIVKWCENVGGTIMKRSFWSKREPVSERGWPALAFVPRTTTITELRGTDVRRTSGRATIILNDTRYR